jgi:antitoxin (DNA-binding transcriptional repressor) of toxin-antitoxin stability system
MRADGVPSSPPAAVARVITATDAAKNFGALVDRVRQDRAVYVVERGGTPVAEVGPVQRRAFTVRDFVEMARSRSGPPLDDEFARAVAEGVAMLNRPRVPGDPWES